jgi:acetyl esterase/lipase
MPLDPHAKRFLDMTAAGGASDVARVTPSEMRSAFTQLALAVACRNVPIGAVEDHVLPGPGASLPVRIYSPVDAGPDRLPGLIYFHGGGFVFGNLDTHDGLCRMLANASGARVAAVEYPLAPEHRFPAAVEYVYGATLWVADNAARLGIDTTRLAIGGDSAGGALAVTVCQRARRGGPGLALQLLFCPVMDANAKTDSRRAFASGYFLDQATIDWSLRHYSAEALNPSDPRVSPLCAAEFAGLPPAHIHTAEFDPVRDEGRAYADSLERAGVAVRYTCHAGMIHHFYGMGGIIPYACTAVAEAGAAVKAALGYTPNITASV